MVPKLKFGGIRPIPRKERLVSEKITLGIAWASSKIKKTQSIGQQVLQNAVHVGAAHGLGGQHVFASRSFRIWPRTKRAVPVQEVMLRANSS